MIAGSIAGRPGPAAPRPGLRRRNHLDRCWTTRPRSMPRCWATAATVWAGTPRREVRVTAPDIAGIDVDYGVDGVTVGKSPWSTPSSTPGRCGRGSFNSPRPRCRCRRDLDGRRLRGALRREIGGGGENPYGFIPFIVFPNLPRPKTTWGASTWRTSSRCSGN